jgi:hypothetical protein
MASECLHVLDVFVEGEASRVGVRIGAAGPALSPMIEVNQLGHVGERAHGRFEAAVIATRATMDDEGDGAFAHDGAVRDETGAFDVEVEAGAANGGIHKVAPFG